MTVVAVIDSETTVPPDQNEPKEVVEVAAVFVDCDTKEVVHQYSSLVKPTKSITARASAIHHITDRDVADAPSYDDAMMPILEYSFEYAVAHNAKFDSEMIDLGDIPWICTYKMASRLFPDFDCHSNQCLRYELGLPAPESGLHTHRALYDAQVTSMLFLHILGLTSVENPFEAMVKISQRPVLLRKCMFGKHAGLRWDEVPKSYLAWILKTGGFDEDVMYTAKHYA